MLILRHIDGRLQEAVRLSTTRDAMRVAIPGFDDAVELKLYGQQWWLEANDPVEIIATGTGANEATRTSKTGFPCN